MCNPVTQRAPASPDVNTDLKTTFAATDGSPHVIFSRPGETPHIGYEFTGAPATRFMVEQTRKKGDAAALWRHFKAYNNFKILWRGGPIKEANVRSDVNYTLIKESPAALKLKNTFSPHILGFNSLA